MNMLNDTNVRVPCNKLIEKVKTDEINGTMESGYETPTKRDKIKRGYRILTSISVLSFQ